jgi:hypothetical protein
MAKDKQQYLEKSSIYQSSIDTILAWESGILIEIQQQDPVTVAFSKMKAVNEMIDVISYCVVLSEVSRSMLESRNEDALNNGRRSITKALSYMEDLVSPYLDTPVSDYQDRLDLIEQVDAKQRYLLVRKLGLAIDLLENACGDNTKWKWSFVDIEGRFATVAKNFFDMKNAAVNMEMRSPNYESAVYHMRLIKKLLNRAADRYREKYELSAKLPNDFKKGIDFLNAMRRIHILFGESDDAELIKRKADAWSSKLDADIKAKEAEKQ